ncbi:futalosine hydrolase [Paenibacillus sp. HB172176]|uniref:futalosine hydrolase n=1 Tax=Paenibacillus sp. HB172176 TaxID=2493690 RepID=UPI001F10F7AB|nr:futalosine hydrolase [Paenibacillus sp. HB172176]
MQELSKEEQQLLIVTAVDAERDAILRGMEDKLSSQNITVIAAGAGPAAVAARTAAALAANRYDLVVSAGIGGGFPGRAAIGTLVLASSIVAADLGAESPDGFLPIDELGFGSAVAAVSEEWNDRLMQALHQARLSSILAPIITVSTATGTAETAAIRSAIVPGAAAEGMEGFGVATAAEQFGVPAVELRAISNAVGPRDRSAWRIGDALRALEEAAAAIASFIRF